MDPNSLCVSCSMATACKHVFTCDEYKVIWCSWHLSKRGRNNWFFLASGHFSRNLFWETTFWVSTEQDTFLPFYITYEVADRRRCFCKDSIQDLLKNITSDGVMNLKWERTINKNQNLLKFKIFLYLRAHALCSAKQMQIWQVSWDWLPEIPFSAKFT